SALLTFIPPRFPPFHLLLLLDLKSLPINHQNILLPLLLYPFPYYFLPLAIALLLSTFQFPNTPKKYIQESRYFVPKKDVT
ncbi:hypothetical protein, partial [Staphylococcus pasteuri]|uniref:hypothetical protein n=1 Tax=Staphylococcus pasteuri TaxID=45972 RepID=UPI001C99324C